MKKTPSVHVLLFTCSTQFSLSQSPIIADFQLTEAGRNTCFSTLETGCKNWFEKISKDLTLPSLFRPFGATLFRAGGESNRYFEKVNRFCFTFFKKFENGDMTSKNTP